MKDLLLGLKIMHKLSDEEISSLNSLIDFDRKQTKQEKAKEIFDDLEKLDKCLIGNMEIDIKEFEKLKKKHLEG